MFHDIFNRFKKNKEGKIKKKPIIIADIHEKNSLILAELANKDVELNIQSLKIGDYLIGDTIIERKTISDLISSMINKRLIQQLNHMQQYKNRFLIIEGDINEIYEEKNNTSKAIRGLILSIISNYKTPVIIAKDSEDTAQYLITLAKQQAKPKTHASLHSRIPKAINEQKKYILESFPNIGPKKAEALLKKFNNLDNIFNASEEELKPILKSRTKEFKDLINSC